MPVPDSMLVDLQDAGYRPITLKSFEYLIAGCRYVCVNDAPPNQFPVVFQIVPNASITWCGYRSIANIVTRIPGSKRRDFERPDSADADKDLDASSSWNQWFGKWSEIVDIRLNPDPKYTLRQWEMEFADFIGPGYSGTENPYNIANTFDNKHPLDPNARLSVDLQRQKAELEAREAAIRQKEAFAEVEKYIGMADGYAQIGDYRSERVFRRNAEDLRKIVQARLDEQAQNSRRYNVGGYGQGAGPLANKSILVQALREAQALNGGPYQPAYQPAYTNTAWFGDTPSGTRSQSQLSPLRWQQPEPPAPKKPALPVAEVHKRKIYLPEDD